MKRLREAGLAKKRPSEEVDQQRGPLEKVSLKEWVAWVAQRTSSSLSIHAFNPSFIII